MARNLSIEEVAEELEVSYSTVRRWLREGRIQGTRRPAPVWAISEDEVARIRAEREMRSAG